MKEAKMRLRRKVEVKNKYKKECEGGGSKWRRKKCQKGNGTIFEALYQI